MNFIPLRLIPPPHVHGMFGVIMLFLNAILNICVFSVIIGIWCLQLIVFVVVAVCRGSWRLGVAGADAAQTENPFKTMWDQICHAVWTGPHGGPDGRGKR